MPLRFAAKLLVSNAVVGFGSAALSVTMPGARPGRVNVPSRTRPWASGRTPAASAASASAALVPDGPNVVVPKSQGPPLAAVAGVTSAADSPATPGGVLNSIRTAPDPSPPALLNCGAPGVSSCR